MVDYYAIKSGANRVCAAIFDCIMTINIGYKM